MSAPAEKPAPAEQLEPVSTPSGPARAHGLPALADILDDYELVQHQDWMSAPGGFK